MAKSTISRHHFDISSLLNICIVPFSVHDLKLSVGRGRKLPKNKHILFNQTKTFDDFFRPFFTVPKFNFSGRPAQTQSSFNDFKIQNQNAQNCFQTLLIYKNKTWKNFYCFSETVAPLRNSGQNWVISVNQSFPRNLETSKLQTRKRIPLLPKLSLKEPISVRFLI